MSKNRLQLHGSLPCRVLTTFLQTLLSTDVGINPNPYPPHQLLDTGDFRLTSHPPKSLASTLELPYSVSRGYVPLGVNAARQTKKNIPGSLLWLYAVVLCMHPINPSTGSWGQIDPRPYKLFDIEKWFKLIQTRFRDF